jgi:hypothetical protein
MTNQLTPTPVTDKNGKQTTVYKRTSGASKKAVSLPAPTLSVPAGTPLRKLKPLNENEAWAWMTSTHVDSSGHVMSDAEGLDDETKAIAKDLGDRGVFTRRAIAALVRATNAGDRGRLNSPMEHNFLLVAERLRLSGLVSESIQYPQCSSLVRSLWGTHFLNTPSKRKPTEKVATQEELDGLAALTYATSYWENKSNADLIKPWHPKSPTTGKKELVYTLHSKPLADLIVERPDEVERIISYIEERGQGRMVPVNSIREYLDTTEGNRTLAEGWL